MSYIVIGTMYLIQIYNNNIIKVYVYIIIYIMYTNILANNIISTSGVKY